MLDRIARPFTLVASLASPLAATAEDGPATPPNRETGPAAPTAGTTGPLEAASALLRDLDGFEVIVSTIVRDADGRRPAPPSSGRVAFARTESGPTFVVETWGGFGSARLACNGRTMIVADPASGCYESRPVSGHPAAWLDDRDITARFGPAAMHILGLVIDDGLAAFRPVGEARAADLGPTRATIVPCRPAEDADLASDGPANIRLAFAADGPPLPLAVAVMLEDGGVVELEFHDWSLGTPSKDAMFMGPSPNWRQVASLPRPEGVPAMTDTPDATIAGADALDDE